MAGERFNLIFEGKVEASHSRDYVSQMFQVMFEFDASDQDELFSGRPVVLGERMDAATANTFKEALAGAGAVTRIVEAGNAAAPDATRERRKGERRILARRRSRVRTESIVPDRRKNPDRRR